MRTVRTSDGYRFFESDTSWVDAIRKDGTPYRVDLEISNDDINDWISSGDADVFYWSEQWTPLYEGPFDSEEEAADYVCAEVNLMMPVRIRPLVNKADGKTIWFIDCRREVTS